MNFYVSNFSWFTVKSAFDFQLLFDIHSMLSDSGAIYKFRLKPYQ